MKTRRLVSTGWHWQYGWLRRPEFDVEGGSVYERPDGDIIISCRPDHTKAMSLNLWEDENGKRHLAPSGVPRALPRKFGLRSA